MPPNGGRDVTNTPTSHEEDRWTPVAAPGNDFPAALAGIVQPDLIMRAAEDLDRIMDDLCRWMRACTVSAPGGGPAKQTTNGEPFPPKPWNAHVWYNGPHRTVHRGNALIEKIDGLVQQVTAMAETMLPRFAATPPAFPSGYPELLAAVLELNSSLRRLLGETWNLLANIDSLTGIGNRNALLRHLRVERERQERNRQPCCVAVIDVDRFKTINDTCGHLAGDSLLRSVASVLAASVRPYDMVFRYGGDEFVLCLPNTDLRLAWAVVERLRLKIAGWEVPLADGRHISTTVSIGVAPLSSDRSVEDTLDVADQALYAAKRLGRNRLCLRDGEH